MQGLQVTAGPRVRPGPLVQPSTHNIQLGYVRPGPLVQPSTHNIQLGYVRPGPLVQPSTHNIQLAYMRPGPLVQPSTRCILGQNHWFTHQHITELITNQQYALPSKPVRCTMCNIQYTLYSGHVNIAQFEDKNQN